MSAYAASLRLEGSLDGMVALICLNKLSTSLPSQSRMNSSPLRRPAAMTRPTARFVLSLSARCLSVGVRAVPNRLTGRVPRPFLCARRLAGEPDGRQKKECENRNESHGRDEYNPRERLHRSAMLDLTEGL